MRVAALALLLFAGTAGAEEPIRVERLTLDRLELVAPPGESVDALVALSGLEVGRAYRHDDVKNAIEILYRLGRFEDVEAYARRFGNVVELRVLLRPRPHVRSVRLVTEDSSLDGPIREALGLKPKDELSTASLSARRRAIEEALSRRGHRGAAVGLALSDRDQNGGAELVVRVDPGPRTRVRRVEVRGRPELSVAEVRRLIGLGAGDHLDLDRLDRGVAALTARYRGLGRYEARVGVPTILEVPPEGGAPPDPLADVVVEVDAGPKIRVEFVGSRLVPRRELEAAVLPLEQAGPTAAALAEAEKAILARYEVRGHWRGQVVAKVHERPAEDEKRVVFHVREGTKSSVVALEFPGRPDVPELAEELLTERVHEVVAQSLSDESARPAVDPAVVGAIVGSRALGEDGPQPHPPEPDPTTLYSPRAYRTAVERLEDLFRAHGFLTVEIDKPEVITLPNERDLIVRFPIRPGVRWTLGALSFSGNEAVDALELLGLTGFEGEPGAVVPLSFYQIEAARRALEVHYRERGHLFVRVDEALREVLPRGSIVVGGFVRTSTKAPLNVAQVCARAAADQKPTCQVELVYTVREGPPVRVRKIRPPIGAEGRLAELILGEAAFVEGELLRSSAIEETERNLLRLGVFRRVSVRTLDPDKIEAEKDVVIEVAERKLKSLEIGVGASTEEGVRGFVGFSHDNVFGSAVQFQANGKVSFQPFLFLYSDSIRDEISELFSERPIEYAISLGLLSPRVPFLPRGFTSGADLSLVRDNDPAFREDVITLSLNASYEGLRPEVLGKRRPISFQLRTTFDRSALECNKSTIFQTVCGASSTDPGRRGSSTTFYASIRPTISVDLRDRPIDSTYGLYGELQTELLLGIGEDSPHHLNLKSRINGYIPLFGGANLALSFLVWRIFPFSGDDVIPVNRRYFAGGRSTIRGYQEQTLFPQDVSSEPGVLSAGGLFFVALKSELRVPFGERLAGTAFFDIGDLFDDPERFELSLRTRRSVGAGIRYGTPIGPLLVDIAFPVAPRRPEEQSWAVHFAAVGSF